MALTPRIAIDAMGGDVGVRMMLAGAAMARHKHDGLRFILVGDEVQIKAALDAGLRKIIIGIGEQIRLARLCDQVQVTLRHFCGALATLAGLDRLGLTLAITRRRAERRQVAFVQLRLLVGVQHTRRAEHFGAATLFFRQIGITAIQTEFQLAFPAAHAAPAVEKNTGNDNDADDDQPLAQTDFHVIPCLYKKC